MNKNTKICTVGGGTAMPVVNRALIRAGFKKINSIVTTFDRGGDTGRIRTDERGGVLAFSDYWRSLMSLWPDSEQKKIWEEMLKYRDGRSRNFGNIFFQFLSEKEGNLDNVDELFTKLTGAELQGEVIPVSLESSDICLRTITGKEYKGENFVDDLKMSKDRIEEIWLDPMVKANPRAVDVIKKAEVIIVGPGTTFGSVLPNFLLEEIKNAYNKSKAKKIFMLNIFSPANETESALLSNYVDTFRKYLGVQSPFDLILMSDLSKLNSEVLKKVFYYYELENAVLVKDDGLEKTRVLKVDVAVVESKNMRLRHDEEKLGKLFSELVI